MMSNSLLAVEDGCKLLLYEATANNFDDNKP